jgi:hypothetical protein
MIANRQRSAIADVALVVGAALLMIALRPSPEATIDGHWSRFVVAVLPSLVLFGIAVWTTRGASRAVVTALVLMAIVGAALFHPVCVPIRPSQVPSFEAVRSLRERAAAGEPFCQFDHRWYQCKSYIARTLF